MLLPLVQQLQQQLGACTPQHCVYVAAAIAYTRQQQQQQQQEQDKDQDNAEAAVLCASSLCQLEQELLG